MKICIGKSILNYLNFSNSFCVYCVTLGASKGRRTRGKSYLIGVGQADFFLLVLSTAERNSSFWLSSGFLYFFL